MILKAKIIKAKAFIKTSSLPTTAEIDLSNMYFNKIGNEKCYQHYKKVLNIIFFNMVGRISDFELQKFLKKIYDY